MDEEIKFDAAMTYSIWPQIYVQDRCSTAATEINVRDVICPAK